MAELLSVGLDVGTTTTQLILSKITAENKASAFAVPKMEITGREVIYKSPVRFTPLLSGELVDGEGIRAMVTAEYEAAGIRREDVDTGAIIVTGETSRKENAREVTQFLSGFAGDFVVATAGPDLESVLAAKGAGAVDYSEETGKTVLHMDIGGGTSNLALIEAGRIAATACLNVGGRLVKLDERGCVTYLSPVLAQLVPYRVGQTVSREQLMQTARLLTDALEAAAGLKNRDAVFEQLLTKEAMGIWEPGKRIDTVSFSGGVADCIDSRKPFLAYGDMGPELGQAIRESGLCRIDYRLGEHTIRATVIGAGCHSAQLSGSTVFLQNVALPLQNLPVVRITKEEQESPELLALVRQRLGALESTGVLALPGWEAPGYSRVTALADALAEGLPPGAVYVALEADMAKALGHALALRLPGRSILCIDRVELAQGCYLDVGRETGPALPVVVKTLIFSA